MNKNTTILLGVIAVLAIGAGAYVSMSKPSQEWFSTQSVRWGTRSLAGGTTFQSKSATTKTTTDTSRGVPTSNWWDWDALSCDTSTITSSLKLVSINDSNPKTSQLEKWSTVTFRQCLDLWDCPDSHIQFDYFPDNQHHNQNIFKTDILNEYDFIQKIKFNGRPYSMSILSMESWCFDIVITINENVDLKELCLISIVKIMDENRNFIEHWNLLDGIKKYPNIQSVDTCFDINTQAEQVPNTPTAIGDSM
jgi:hypothetical protein